MNYLLQPHDAPAAGARMVRSGSTLVEVLWAVGLLALMAIAAGSFVSMSSGVVSVTRNQRMALEAANSRLEDIRSAGFNAVRPTNLNFATYYLSRDGDAWRISNTDPQETLWIQGRAYPIVTTLQYMDASGGQTACEMLQVTVTVFYRQNEPNKVQLWAYVGP